MGTSNQIDKRETPDLEKESDGGAKKYTVNVGKMKDNIEQRSNKVRTSRYKKQGPGA